MEKKEYIEPSLIVRTVNPYLMQGVSGHDEIGDGVELSKENFGTGEGGTESNLEIRDVWED